LGARLLDLDPMKTRSVEQGDKNQNERTDAKCRKRFKFIRNLSQECRNIGSPSAVLLTQLYNLLVYGNTHCGTTVAFDRCSATFLAGR